MKKIIMLIVIFCLVQQGFSQEKQQKKSCIKFDTRTYDFGKVKQDKGKIEATFNFTNTGTDTLKILNVRASYGCTSTNWTQEPVLPNKKGIIKAVYDTKNKSGEFQKNIFVTTNDPLNVRIILTVKGEVVSKKAIK